MKRLLVFLSLFVPLSLSAQERRPDAYERFLVPAGPASGAFGAVWRTELWLRNDSDRPVDVFPVNEKHCPVSAGCTRLIRAVPSLGARETAFGFFAGNNVALAVVSDMSVTGSFFYVERGRAGDLSMQFHVFDVSRSPAEVTRLPIVPEGEFFNTTRSILGARLAVGSRVALRIFQLDPSMPDEVTVRVFEDEPDGGLLAARRFRFVPGTTRCSTFFFFGCDGEFVHHPGYLVIGDLLQEFPEIAGTIGAPFGVRIEVEPAPGLRYWPMVTVTENATNHVTVHTVR